MYAFYEWNKAERQLITIRYVKRKQNGFQDDVMRDAQWSSVPLKFKWR